MRRIRYTRERFLGPPQPWPWQFRIARWIWFVICLALLDFVFC